MSDAPCTNCDDRKCMDCVCRTAHDICVNDCPSCCEDTASNEWAYDEAVGWYNLEDDPATTQETALLEQLAALHDDIRRADGIVSASLVMYAATAAPITANYTARLKAAEAAWGQAVRNYLSAQGLNPGPGGSPSLELGDGGSVDLAAPHGRGDAVTRQHPTGAVNNTEGATRLEGSDTLSDSPTGGGDVLGGVGGGHDMIKHHNVTDVNREFRNLAGEAFTPCGRCGATRSCSHRSGT